MPTFRYRAYGAGGSFAEGTIEAASQELAGDLLWAQGLTAFDMRAAGESGTKWWQREVFTRRGSRLADLAAFTREFATLKSAEIPLDDALRIVGEQTASTRLRAVVQALTADVLNGATLSDAMLRQPAVFPGDYVSMVRAGELSGADGQIFADLADLLDRRLEIRSRIHSALVYPCVLMALSVGTLAILMGSLIPSIAPIFAESGKAVPTVIRILLALQEQWLALLSAATVLAIATAVAIMLVLRRPAMRAALDRRLLSVPIIGPFLLRQEAARLTRTLGTMLKAGVPLVQAVKATRDVVRNAHLAAGVDRTLDALQRGVSLQRALRAEVVLPPAELRMISIGEEAGKLDRMLLRVAAMCEQQTQTGIDRFMAALTPALTLAIAGLVAVLILPVMNAVLSINELVVR